jgi:hypothetical protein
MTVKTPVPGERERSITAQIGAPDSIERTLVGKARRVVDHRPK